jgi:hypothetical protein
MLEKQQPFAQIDICADLEFYHLDCSFKGIICNKMQWAEKTLTTSIFLVNISNLTNYCI